MERGKSFREKLLHKPTPSLPDDDSVTNTVKPSPIPATDSTDSALDFEKRLQYAMQQSLILQERQLKDIETLQEELGRPAAGMHQRVVVPNKKTAIEKIRKPLKGILKKSLVRCVFKALDPHNRCYH